MLDVTSFSLVFKSKHFQLFDSTKFPLLALSKI